MTTNTESRILTLAAVHPHAGAGQGDEYLFNELARIFVLKAPAKKALEAHPTLLNSAISTNRPVKVVLNHGQGTIEQIAPVLDDEAHEFHSKRQVFAAAAPPVKYDAAAVETAKLHVEESAAPALAAPAALLNNVIPNLATAQTIFNYCVQQSCTIPGPHAVNPCIPFQYVIDGCYARAHKMMWIITTKYGYACSKLFSFANTGNFKLAVKANKWGGCCVTWWYHVAPLVQVQIASNTVRWYVMDPGMFNNPVPWVDWINAQKTKTCSANAGVSTYTSQPASAYQPANYQGNQFTTDPNYVLTDQTLLKYQKLKTCP
jgi:hypothetical protein